MNSQSAAIAANETPEGTITLFSSFNGDDGYFNCRYVPDVVYATHSGQDLKLQIIMPAFYSGKLPLVLFVQGSAWRKQELYANIPNLCNMAARGYVIASVEYRDTDTAKFPAQVEDAKAAIRFMRANADKYCVDPSRVAIWGDSSGGHIALMVGLSEGKFLTDVHPEQSDHVSAVIDFYGITDIPSLGLHNDVLDHDSPDSPEALLIGGAIPENRRKAELASPSNWISDNDSAPILMVHGDCDAIVHVSQSIQFYKALKKAGKRVVLCKVVGADHGLGVWNREVLDTVHKFLTATLKAKVADTPLFQHKD